MNRYITTLITIFGMCVCLQLNAFDIPSSADFESDTIGSEPAGFADLKAIAILLRLLLLRLPLPILLLRLLLLLLLLLQVLQSLHF